MAAAAPRPGLLAVLSPLLVLVLVLLAGRAHSTGPASSARPNLIFVLADDLNMDWEQDRHALMPTLKKYFVDGGIEFMNHVAAAPVCGPSRSSLLAGRYPHNVGYVANGAKASIARWAQQENNTFGTWATDAGYYTAFLGKYVNSMECNTPSGWRHWGGLTCGRVQGKPVGGTYNFYNASQWNVNYDATGKKQIGPQALKIWEGVHQSHFLANATLEQAGEAVKEGRPFLIHTTPVMVHWGTCYGPQPEADYAPDDPHREWKLPDPDQGGKVRAVPMSPCPTIKNKERFVGVQNPHFPSWNRSADGTVPSWIQQRGDPTKNGCCDNWAMERENIGFRNRSSSVVDLDDFFARLFSGLEEMGQLDNTFVIFSSDNGYHLGEHRLLFGKSEPYDTDIRLPLYIRGPGVAQGETRPHPTNHMDITRTIVDLLSLDEHAPVATLDGLSFKPLLTDQHQSVDAWRSFSFSEFYVAANTWHTIRVMNATGGPDFKFTWWCSNQSEVFRLADDPWELSNLAGAQPTPYGSQVLAKYLPITTALGKCSGANCIHPEAAAWATPSNGPLPCHVVGEYEDVMETHLDPNFPPGF